MTILPPPKEKKSSRLIFLLAKKLKETSIYIFHVVTFGRGKKKGYASFTSFHWVTVFNLIKQYALFWLERPKLRKVHPLQAT